MGTGGATLAGRTIASNLLKMIPGIGTAAGGMISGATAAILTTALGETYIVIMEMMLRGDISTTDKDFDKKIKDIFKKFFSKKTPNGASV